MKLVHYSASPIVSLHRTIRWKEHRPKPSGLWVSDDDCADNWESWCKAEAFQLDGLRYAYEVDLDPEVNLLILSKAYHLAEFTTRFSRFRLRARIDTRFDIFAIDWGRVQKDFDGLVISPYQWGCRLELMWYYGWDCASGCIWNVDKISIKERPILAAAAT